MNYRIITGFVLAAAAFAACSEREGDASPSPAPDGTSTRVELLGEGIGNGTVYAFRRQDDRFLFDTLFRAGWNPQGSRSVRMRRGDYRFLFASGEGENLSLTPASLTRATTWEEAAFALRADDAAAGVCFPADELFLQFPAADAERIYTVGSSNVSVSARLTRAVSQIGVTLKRGYRDGAGYVEVPYTAPHSVLDEIERVDLTVSGAGRSVRPDGYAGTAAVSASLATADYTELTEQGFVRLDGPFILPAADGAPVALTLAVTPAAGSALQPVEVTLEGLAERNKRLDVTLWITSGYPVVGVEIRTMPIGQEQNGDEGIWE
ncbi:hypothetical protein [Alistipes sp.]|uniref:hypothetical protein n=1 Tax=Alistipes sp. TaxID=1872444 RepID=UPI003AF0AA12